MKTTVLFFVSLILVMMLNGCASQPYDNPWIYKQGAMLGPQNLF